MLASPCEEEPDAEEYDDPTVLEDLSKASKAKIHLTIFKQTPDMPFLFSNSKSWTLQLPKKVDVECIAVNDKYCCACTSPSNTLHFWSLFGSCSFHPNISIPGKPICLTTTSDGERLLIVYEKTLGIDSVYNLGYMILEKKDTAIPVFSILIDSHLPLSENDSVNWIGFSIDTNHPYLVAQNSGKLLKLPMCVSEPVIECATLQSSRPTFDFYWILYVEEICAEVSAILCKGSHYPAKGEAMNQQIISFHDKSKNLFAIENVGKEDKITIQSQYSQLLHLTQLQAKGYDSANKDVLQTIIKLFGDLMKLDNDGRLYEITLHCNDPDIIAKLSRLALRKDKQQLGQALQDLSLKVQARLEQEEEIESEEEIQEVEAAPFGLSPVVKRVRNLSVERKSDDEAPLETEEINDEEFESDKENNYDMIESIEPAPTPVNPFAKIAPTSTPRPSQSNKNPMNFLQKIADKKRETSKSVEEKPPARKKAKTSSKQVKLPNFSKKDITKPKKSVQSNLAMFARKK